MNLLSFSVGRWQRRFGLLLAGLFIVVGSTVLPAPAQEFDQSPFCIASDEPLTDSVQGRSYGDPHVNTYDRLH